MIQKRIRWFLWFLWSDVTPLTQNLKVMVCYEITNNKMLLIPFKIKQYNRWNLHSKLPFEVCFQRMASYPYSLLCNNQNEKKVWLKMRNPNNEDQWFIFKTQFQNQKILLTMMVTRWIKYIIKREIRGCQFFNESKW